MKIKKIKELFKPEKPDFGVPQKNAFLAVPCYDGMVNAAVSQAITTWAVMGLTGTSPHMVFSHYEIGAAPVEYARNRCVEKFLSHPEMDTLFMVDADMIPRIETIRLLDSGADIAIAPAPMFVKTDEGKGLLTYNLFVKDGDKYAVWRPGEEPYCGGTGCIAISRRVLEDPRMRVGDKPNSIFRTVREDDGKCLVGEDVDFCDRAIQLGYSVEIVWGARCDHAKETALHFYAESVLADHGSNSPAYLELAQRLGEAGLGHMLEK